jgi:hypothetical protein
VFVVHSPLVARFNPKCGAENNHDEGHPIRYFNYLATLDSSQLINGVDGTDEESNFGQCINHPAHKLQIEKGIESF